MESSRKKFVASLLVVIGLVAVMVGWHYTHLPKGSGDLGGDSVTLQVNSFDEFQDSLASRVVEKLGASSSNLTGVVAIAAYPVGTLLGSAGSVPANLDDCVPQNQPKAYNAGRLFPSYTLSTGTALAANIGSHAIEGLDSAGVSLKQSSMVKYKIDDAQIQMLDDKSVEQLTGGGACGSYIMKHPGTRLIRGFVIGRVTFTVEVDNPASVKAKLSRLADFTISDNPGSSTVSVSDQQSEPIVELLSEIGNAITASQSVKPSIVMGPTVEPGAKIQTHIYIQQDIADNPASGTAAVQTIRNGWPTANVESKVQRIPTDKMPSTGQIRYFNAADIDIATKCQRILQPSYPNMRVVRIGLASPAKQLEVWLPKAGTPASGLTSGPSE